MEIDEDFIENLVEQLKNCFEENDLKSVETLFNCSIKLRKEKVHSLHHNYFFWCSFKNYPEHLFIEIESSIDVGTEVREVSWGGEVKSNFKEVVVRYEFDNDAFEEFTKGFKNQDKLREEAIEIFNQKLPIIKKYERQLAYDNYVTGGNGRFFVNTDLKKPLLFYKAVYEYLEVDRRWV